jgi:hypothetical protein
MNPTNYTGLLPGKIRYHKYNLKPTGFSKAASNFLKKISKKKKNPNEKWSNFPLKLE